MEKLKRYLGLAVAVALLALAFLPFENNRHHPMASKVTPLDSTILTKLTGVGGRDMLLWTHATDYINRCIPFRETSIRIRSLYVQLDCEGDNYLFSTFAREYEAELSKFEPTLPTLHIEYLNTPKLIKETEPVVGLLSGLGDTTHTSHSIYLKSLEGQKRNLRSLQLELQIGTAMSKYLQSVSNSIAIGIYLLHGFAILLFAGLVWARRAVGAILLWPFTLIFGAVKAGSGVVKSLHDKV